MGLWGCAVALRLTCHTTSEGDASSAGGQEVKTSSAQRVWRGHWQTLEDGWTCCVGKKNSPVDIHLLFSCQLLDYIVLKCVCVLLRAADRHQMSERSILSNYH